LVPFLDYYLTQDLHIKHVSGRTIQERGIYIAQLFFHYWKVGDNALTGDEGMRHSHAMGIGFLLGCCVLTFGALWFFGVFHEKKDKRYVLGKYATILGGMLMIMSLKFFPWDRIQNVNNITASLVSSIQFPNRFLGWGTVFAVTVFGVLIYHFKWYDKLCYYLGVIAVFISVTTCSMYVMEYINTGLDQMRIYNEEGMGFGYISGEEYKIEGTKPEKLLYSGPRAGEGVTVLQYSKNYLDVKMTVDNEVSKDSYVDLPLINYKGYQVVDVSTGNVLPISMGDNGVVRVEIPGSYVGEIEVTFTGMWYWRVAEVISYITWGLLGFYFVNNKVKQRRHKDVEGVLKSA